MEQMHSDVDTSGNTSLATRELHLTSVLCYQAQLVIMSVPQARRDSRNHIISQLIYTSQDFS